MFKVFISGALFVLLAQTSLAAPAMSGADVLVDDSGMTVYTFDKDTNGTSNCYDGCAASWPPVVAKDGSEASGDFTIVNRRDGSAQWAYKGMPLYTWVGDAKPGDMTGDGVGGVWHVVK